MYSCTTDLNHPTVQNKWLLTNTQGINQEMKVITNDVIQIVSEDDWSTQTTNKHDPAWEYQACMHIV